MEAVSVPSTSNKQIILSLCNMILDLEILSAAIRWITNAGCFTAKWSCLAIALEKQNTTTSKELLK
jgi:hypothetical protein